MSKLLNNKSTKSILLDYDIRDVLVYHMYYNSMISKESISVKNKQTAKNNMFLLCINHNTLFSTSHFHSHNQGTIQYLGSLPKQEQ